MESAAANERLDEAGPTGPAAFGRGIGFANGGRESSNREHAGSVSAFLLNSLGAGRAATARAESLGVARLVLRSEATSQSSTAALSEGTHPTRDRAGKGLCPRDRSGGQELASRPGRRVPPRAMTATPGAFAHHPALLRYSTINSSVTAH